MRLGPVVISLMLALMLAPWPISAQPSEGFVHVALTALQSGTEVRYSLLLLNSSDGGLRDVRVEVDLPPGSEVTRALETPGRTQFLGVDGSTLRWSAPSISSSRHEVADTFSFVLARALDTEARVRVTWSGGSAEISERPQPIVAAATEDQIVVAEGGSGDGFLPVGTSGVYVHIAPGSLPTGTVLRFARLGPEVNPPADDTLWWCAALTVDGLPGGASVVVLVPARQPLPPMAEVTLSARKGAVWELMEQVGTATGDGQFVAFVHSGGTIAAGVSLALQPRATQFPPTTSAQPTAGPTPTATPAPLRGPALVVSSLRGPNIIMSQQGASYHFVVENRGEATARRVLIVVSGNLVPFDFNSLEPLPACQIERSAADLGARGGCVVDEIAPGGRFAFDLRGVTSLVTGKTRTSIISMSARDNLGGKALTAAGSYWIVVAYPQGRAQAE